jgi:ribosomal protein L1
MEKGQINFEKLFTTPTHLSKLKHLGKMLGPKGLMPNAKLNTLVPLEELPRALR